MWFLARFFITVCALSSLVPAESNAQTFFQYKYTKMGAYMLQFSGDDGLSFTEDAASYGLEAAQVFSNSWFGLESKVRGGSLSGAQAFDDNGVDREANYSFYYGEFVGGVRLYFVPMGETTFAAHFGAAGIVGLHQLSIDSDDEDSTLPQSSSAAAFGHEINCGGELRFGGGMTSSYILYADVAVRTLPSKIAGKSNFSTNGLYVSVGFGW